MSSSVVRFGLVGYGFGGRFFHAPLIAAAAGCDLVGVVTGSPQRREELARDHPGTLAYGSLDAASARETVALAERAGVVLSVYQNRRWDADMLTVRRLISDGSLGTVGRFESRFERFAPEPGPPAAGGGSLLDFGSHLVDQALTLFGPADQVYAEMHVRADGGGLDDDVFVALRHTSGVRAHLWGSWVQGAPGLRLRVTGTTGSYVVDGVDGQEDALRSGRSPATEGDRWGVETEERWGRIQRGARNAAVPSERGRWDTFYPAFAGAVRGAGPVPVDPWDAVASLEVLDAARTSAAQAQVQTLQPVLRRLADRHPTSG